MTRRFLADFGALTHKEKALTKTAVRDMNAAYEAYQKSGRSDRIKWPASLRIQDVEGAPGIWEMTWSFRGPDGRATFEFVRVGVDQAVRWRRIGGHEIFGEP